MSEKRANFWNVPEQASGAWAEKRALAEALRELIALCVSTDAPEASLRAAAETTRAISATLVEHPQRRFADAHGQAKVASDLHEFADRGVLIGRSNPIAPPMRFEFVDGVSHGEVVFGVPYEGAPGWVHGGIVAAAFDQAFGHLQVNLEVPSFTGVLTIKYRRPTPHSTPLRFESRLDRRDGRKSFVLGQCYAGDVLTAEAEALFIEVAPDRIREMVASPGAPSNQES